VLLCVLSSDAWATFPGHNGPLALTVYQAGVETGVVKVPATGPPLDANGPHAEFYYGCQAGDSPTEGTCQDGSPMPASAGRATFSSDGRQLVLAVPAGIAVEGTNRQGFHTLGPFTRHDFNPAWSPSGRWIVFTGAHSDFGPTTLYRVHPDGSGLQRLIGNANYPAVSPNGHLIVFDRPAPHESRDLWVMNANGTHPHRLARNGETACFSPDGKHLVFTVPSGRESPNTVTKIQRMDINGSHRVTLVTHGDSPSWSPDGRHIAYAAETDYGSEAGLYEIPARGGRRTLRAQEGPVGELGMPLFGPVDWDPRAG
jgi:dipeptidyl aminopeptidase/acylaminoacyl peptidase